MLNKEYFIMKKYKHIVKKILFLGVLITPFNGVLADYQIYMMNNTPSQITTNNDCGTFHSDNCTAYNDKITAPFKRQQIFSVNYDKGITSGDDFKLKSYFTLPSGQKNNYFTVTFHGDQIGSHVKSIDVFVANKSYNLLNDDNSQGKVLANSLAQKTFKDSDGQLYSLYVDTQKDRVSTLQGIDDIFFTLNKKPVFFTSNATNEITLATYNIIAFPDYVTVALDLNKLDERISYLINHADLDFDVIVFEEAWDRDVRNKIINGLKGKYPYNFDPIPANTHNLPLNSGLLVLSKHPISKKFFINYQDYQTLTDADRLSNKGALFVSINKGNKKYNIIATHTQATNTKIAIKLRQEEFSLIRKHIIGNVNLSISKSDPLILMGDLNTDYYDKIQFNKMSNTLNLSNDPIENTLYKAPKYSNDSDLNLMISASDKSKEMCDYIVPFRGFLEPNNIQRQITPIRALNDKKMYTSPIKLHLYNYGDIELSDHFLVQAKFIY